MTEKGRALGQPLGCTIARGEQRELDREILLQENLFRGYEGARLLEYK